LPRPPANELGARQLVGGGKSLKTTWTRRFFEDVAGLHQEKGTTYREEFQEHFIFKGFL